MWPGSLKRMFHVECQDARQALIAQVPMYVVVFVITSNTNGQSRFMSSLMEKNYSKLFGESLFKTIKNYSHYSPTLNWRTIGRTIEINRRKLLRCSSYSPMLNYMCRRGRAYLKSELLINFIKSIQKIICRLRNLFLTLICHLTSLGSGFHRIIFLPIPGFESMPYLSHYLHATTLPTIPTVTWQINVSKFCLSMNCKFR